MPFLFYVKSKDFVQKFHSTLFSSINTFVRSLDLNVFHAAYSLRSFFVICFWYTGLQLRTIWPDVDIFFAVIASELAFCLHRVALCRFKMQQFACKARPLVISQKTWSESFVPM
jgi:hypothetical protein